MADDNSGSGSGWLALAGLGLSSAAQIAGQVWANRRNEKANNKRWKESVSLANTAHQREVADLRKAGLNPILSSMGGNGAPSPDISAVTVDNPAGSAMQVASILNQRQQAMAQTKAADAAKLNSETQAWQIYDARTMGYAGFDVGISKGKFGLGGDGKFERVYTIRINKVTGEAYTVPDNKPIKAFRPVEQTEVNSGKSTTGSSPVPFGKPLTININKTEGGKSTFDKDNPHLRGRYPQFRLRHF